MHFYGTLALILLFGLQALGLPLPKYVTPCFANDPEFHECIKKSGKATLRNLIGGDPEYNIPAIDPLHIDNLVIDQGIGAVAIKLNFKDFDMVGLSDTHILVDKTDLKARKIEVDFVVPILKILGPYIINGKILLLPIVGEGQSNITCINVNATMTLMYDLITRKDGLEYVKIKRLSFKLNPEKLYIELENLFNGDKTLGRHMNGFMNENWQLIFDDVRPAIEDVFSRLAEYIFTQIFKNVPYHVAFPTK